jgi:hypothetical protein
MIIGFRVDNLKACSRNWGYLNTNTILIEEINKFIDEKIWDNHLTINETIDLLNLKITNYELIDIINKK